MSAMDHYVRASKWMTVYSYIGSPITLYGEFRHPSGTQIRIRYGKGWFSRNRQHQELDGFQTKTLKHSGITSYFRVRFQVKVPYDTHLRWDLFIVGP